MVIQQPARIRFQVCQWIFACTTSGIIETEDNSQTSQILDLGKASIQSQLGITVVYRNTKAVLFLLMASCVTLVVAQQFGNRC